LFLYCKIVEKGSNFLLEQSRKWKGEKREKKQRQAERGRD
jgi:hypothetical protein